MGCPHLASRPLLTRTTALLHRFSTPALKHRTHPVSLRPTVILSRAMSHKPQIIETEQFSTPAKWLRLERIKWRDQEGKEVGSSRPRFPHELMHSVSGRLRTAARGPRAASTVSLVDGRPKGIKSRVY